MIKRSHTIFAAAMLALSAAAFAPAVASAQVGVSLEIGNAPPPPRFESVPVARRGYIWAPGYWNWDGRRHVWLAGHWEQERYGQSFRGAEWVRTGNGWRLDQGGWVTVESRPVSYDDRGYVAVAPPPPRYERVPHPRPGYVWSPGYWDWRGNRHEWVAGYWIAERPGYAYYEPRWVEREGHWRREEGRWERGGRGDRDHDGVPNRYDRDRDGDGIPNRYDHHPDNPRRD
jgi:hypothetical protein